jgi:hypothetical protein
MNHKILSASFVSLCFLVDLPSPIEDDLTGFVTTGTAIAIIAKGNQIAAAADSKILLGRGLMESSDCKIKEYGDSFFAIAGHRREELSDFDAIYIATEACRGTRTIGERIEKFETLIKPALHNMLWVSQRKAPSYFENSLKNKTILQVAFFGFENGSPYLYVRSYKDQTSSAGIALEIERRECQPRCDMLTILGKKRAAEKHLAQKPESRKKNPIELVKELVELEIAAEPEIVGPPIDLLKISKDGAVWIQKKMYCE